ncbi:MAG: GAF domain-containing protein [Chloroflexaceae bacterium]|nr:GAF domain-containing protein [Chloroflexaceae bacterium]
MFQRELEQTSLFDMIAASRRLRSFDAVFDMALENATRLIGAEVAVFYLWDDTNRCLTVCGTRGAPLDTARPHIVVDTEALSLFNTLRHWNSNQPTPGAIEPLVEHYGIVSALGIPVQTEGVLQGWMYVARTSLSPFDEHEVMLFALLADQVADSLEVVTVFERYQHQQTELLTANERLEAMLTDMTHANRRLERSLQIINELSSPILTIAQGILLIPLIGTIDAHRSAHIKETMLAAISERRARIVILDITAISLADEQVANTLLEATSAVKLLGAQLIVCGMSPQFADLVICLGVQMNMPTVGDLATALEMALHMQHSNGAVVRPAVRLGRRS